MPRHSDYVHLGGVYPNDGVSYGEYQQLLEGRAIRDDADVFSDWLRPQSKEERQMGEQLLMDKLEPSAQMEGMKRAGINPLTAAAGIAGSSSSLPQPSSSVNPLGDIAGAVSQVGSFLKPDGSMLSGLAQLAQTPSQSRLNDANANKANKEADEVHPLAQAQILRQYAASTKDLTDSGIDEITAAGIAFDSSASGMTSGISNLLRGDNVVRRIDKEMRKFDDMHEIDTRTWKLQEDELTKNQYRIPQAEYEMQITEIQRQREDLARQRDELLTKQWERFNGDPCLDQANRLYDIQQQFGFDSPQYKAAMRIAYDSNYYSSLAGYDAEVNDVFAKAFNEQLGINKADALYKAYNKEIDFLYDALLEMYKETFKSPKGFIEAAAKLLSLPATASMSVILNSIAKDVKVPKAKSLKSHRHETHALGGSMRW